MCNVVDWSQTIKYNVQKIKCAFSHQKFLSLFPFPIFFFSLSDRFLQIDLSLRVRRIEMNVHNCDTVYVWITIKSD